MKNKYLKIIEIIIMFSLIISILIMISINIQARTNSTQIPSIFGIRFMTVLTGSMKPSLKPGDVIISKSVLPEKIKSGDIITYMTSNNVLVTHRVFEVKNSDNQISFKTKGDYNNSLDNSLINSNQLVGKSILKIPKIGYIAILVRKPLGFILIIVIPIFALEFKQLKNSLLNAIKDNKKIKLR